MPRMDVCENGAVLRLRTASDGYGDAAALRIPSGGELRKRRERGEVETRRVWSLGSKRFRRDGDEACVHGRIVEPVLRCRDGGAHRIDAECESPGSVRPWRFMYFEKGDWVKFPEEANSVAWERFRAGESTAEVVVERRVYLLRFAEMTQVNVATGYVRSIAWIDDGLKVSLPGNPSAGMPGAARTTSWRDGATDSISSFMLGSGGDVFGDDELTRLTLGHRTEEESSPGLGQRFAKLEPGCSDFEDVKASFLSGFGRLADETRITGIHRDSSPVAMARQEAFERQKLLTEQARGNANVRFGWHGTSKKGVAGIFMHGFGQPKTPKNGSAYGVGVYLAVENQAFVSALYADNDENGEQHVVLCQVVAGASELVKPPSEQFHPSSEHYDTGVDDLVAPKRLIIWSTHMNTHVLPLYVVSFKLPPRWHRMMAELNGKQRISSLFGHDVPVKHPLFMKQACGMAEALRHKICGMASMRNKPTGCTALQQGPTSAFIRFPQLFALLRRLLSAEQCLSLKNYYAEYEAGNMSRKTLVQEIQRMVGKDCLIHAIQVCQGFQGSQGASAIKAQ